ncbi:MAG: hydrogenase maturation nickel metallochaperone HypA/HybF [Blastocatellia bacterium]
MHELSIAMSIVEGASEESAHHPGWRVDAVRLKLGHLSGVVKDALLFSYEIACEGTPLAGSRLEIEEVFAAIFCRKCDAEREVALIQDFRCPVCGTASSEVVRGRELLIVGLELKEEYAASAC